MVKTVYYNILMNRRTIWFGKMRKACQLLFLLTFLLCGTVLNGIAQTTTNREIAMERPNLWSYEGGIKTGKVFKHRDEFLPDITERSFLYELNLVKSTNGQQLWNQYYAYPELGISFLYGQFGDREIFGRAYGIIPSIRLMQRYSKLKIHYHLGIGLSYVSRPFNAVTNPINNVVSSKFNNLTMLQLALAYQLSKQWQLLGTLSFTHYSNAKVQIPNLGINIPAFGLNLRYSPKGIAQKSDLIPQEKPRLEKRPWKFNLKIGHAFVEDGKYGGPRYSVFIGNAFLTKRISLVSQIQAGIEANYYEFIYHFIHNQVAFADKERLRSSKVAAYGGYEVLFGRISGVAQIGVYLYDPFLEKAFFYTKIGLQAYLHPTYQRQRKQWFVGVYLKTHYATADYAEMAIGYTF